MKIARVFATKTNMCPTDPDAYFDEPDLFTTPLSYDEVHISVTFTWAINRGWKLLEAWKKIALTKIGGPALGDPGNGFTAGIYLKPGIVITSRGCPNNCSFCFVPTREGKIKELPITRGNIIQDNNLLACSNHHLDQVFKMLEGQRHINFAGGLEASRITDNIVERLRGLRIHQIWVAYDMPRQEKALIKAVERLKKCFPRDKIRCYVLIGYKDDTLEKAEGRLKRAWEIGTKPFAMLYCYDKKYAYSKDWKLLQRNWTRPAIITSIMKGPQ